MLGRQEGQLSPALLCGGAGLARITLLAEIFTSLLCCEGAFSGILDSFVQDSESQIPNLTIN